MMKTLQTKIMLSFLVLNLFIVFLISFSTTRGFINISGAWAHRQSTEASALLSEYFSENKNRNLFREEKTEMEQLIKLELWDAEKEKVFSWDTTAQMRPENTKDYSGIIRKLINYELNKNPESSAIKSINPIIVDGKIAGYCSSLLTPLIGFDYTSFFDKIFTSSFLTGVTISLILSVIISILLSFQISRSSAQLVKDELIQQRWLADITHDLKSPVTALRSQLDAVIEGNLPPYPLLRGSIQPFCSGSASGNDKP